MEGDDGESGKYGGQPPPSVNAYRFEELQDERN